MKKSLIKSRRTRTLLSISLLIAAFACLASGLIPTARSGDQVGADKDKRGKCKNWIKEQDKPAVRDVFNKLLEESAANTQAGRDLRKKLINPANCYKEAKDTVNNRLPANIKLPADAIVIFFEDEDFDPNKARTYRDIQPGDPKDSCYHILALGETKSNKKATFAENLMCCYKPW
jgi:hypothetical protein